VLSKDQESFTRYLKSIFDTNPNVLATAKAKSQRVNRIIDLLQDGAGNELPLTTGRTESVPNAFVAAVSIVYIAVGVVTYALVASQAAVVLNVAALATAAVKLAVKVYGEEQQMKAIIPTSKIEGTSTPAAAIRNLQRASIAAEIYGRKDLGIEAFKKTINMEVDAVFSAAEQTGLIKFPTAKRRLILNEMKTLCYEAVGV